MLRFTPFFLILLPVACARFDWTTSPDKPVLRIISVSPADAATGIAVNSTMTIIFSHSMNTTTIGYNAANGACTGSLQVSGDNFSSCIGIASGLWTNEFRTITLSPVTSLPAATEIKIRITTAAAAVNGLALSGSYESDGFRTLGDVWVSRAIMPNARVATLVAVNGRVHALGAAASNNHHAYDPVTDSWITRADLPAERSEFPAIAYNNKIYMFGGCAPGCPAQNSVYEYNALTDAWTNCGGSCANMPTPRYASGAAEANGKVYVFGGYNGAFLNLTQEYSIATNSWTNCGGSCPAMANQREGAAAVLFSGKIYVMGGRWTPDFVTWFHPDQVEEFDYTAYTWVTRASTISPGGKPVGIAAIGSKIYTAWNENVTTFYEYDAATNTFASRANKLAYVGNYSGATLNGKFYAIRPSDGLLQEYTPP